MVEAGDVRMDLAQSRWILGGNPLSDLFESIVELGL
jgi:hypothetical protein